MVRARWPTGRPRGGAGGRGRPANASGQREAAQAAEAEARPQESPGRSGAATIYSLGSVLPPWPL